MEEAKYFAFVTYREPGKEGKKHIEDILEKYDFKRGHQSDMLTSLNIHYISPKGEVILVNYGRGNWWMLPKMWKNEKNPTKVKMSRR